MGEKEARRSEAVFLGDWILGVDVNSFDGLGDPITLDPGVKSMVAIVLLRRFPLESESNRLVRQHDFCRNVKTRARM